MKKQIFTFTLLISSLSWAYAQQPMITYDATLIAKELGIKCQTLKIAQNACVIAHFKFKDDDSDAYPTQKTSDLYRVLNGKTSDNQYIATDYYSNGQQQSSTFTTPDANAVKTGWQEVEAQITALKNTHWTREGHKTSQYDVINGLSQGTYTSWYTNGQKQMEGQNKDGKAVGLWTEWYENGQKKSEQHYVNDALDGTSITWHENGTKRQEGQYASDQRQGVWLTYAENGTKIEQMTYDQGQANGDYATWYDDGKKRERAFYKNDGVDGQFTAWYPNGEKAVEYHYSNGVAEGIWKAWNPDGQLTDKTEYKNGEVIYATEQAATATTEAVEATEALPASSTTAKDADAAAAELGTECRTFKRPDQCVIAYFDQNDDVQSSSKNAKYYRVLYGQVNQLFVLQDFHNSGKKQSNVFFSGSYSGTLNSFYNEDMAIQGNVKGFDRQGRMYYSSEYDNGREVDSAVDHVSCSNCDSAAQAAVDAANSAVIDAAKAAAAAVSAEVK